MSGALGRLPYPQMDPNRDANSLQSYLGQISQLRNITTPPPAPPPQPGPQVVSADNRPFDPMAMLTPQGPVMQSQLAAAHQQRQAGQDLALATTLGMAGGAPGAHPNLLARGAELGERATLADRGPTHGTEGSPERASAAGPLVGRYGSAEQVGDGGGGERGGAPPQTYQGRSPTPSEALVNPDVARIHEAVAPYPDAASPPYHELHPGETSADVFHRAISDTKKAHPAGAAVTLYDKPDYAGMRLFTTPNRDAGFALKGDDIVSVFKHPGAPHRNVTRSMLDLAVKEGGRRLDAFDTVLPDIYGKSGFRVVARLPWNEEYAPPGWKHDTFGHFNEGRPDVVFMVHDPKGAAPYKRGDGRQVFDYDEGIQAQHDALTEIDRKRPNALSRHGEGG